MGGVAAGHQPESMLQCSPKFEIREVIYQRTESVSAVRKPMFSEALGSFASLEIREVIIPFNLPFENQKLLFHLF